MSIGVIDRGVAASPEFMHAIDNLIAPVTVDSLKIDRELRLHAAERIAAIAIPQTVEVIPVNQTVDLAEACKKAREGSEEAKCMVRTNVRTDYFERGYKSGHVTRVRIRKTPAGLVQYGQLLADTHANSIRFLHEEVLQERSKTELVNSVRSEFLAREEALKDNLLVTFSLVTRKTTEANAKKLGFFTDTMSLAIQAMSEDETEIVEDQDNSSTGEIVLETAFVAGRENDSESPFDVEAVRELVKGWGIDFSGLSADEILASPILVPKAVAGNILEVVKLYDAAVERVKGRKVFFGKITDRDAPDYEAYSEECMKRETDMHASLEENVRILIESSHDFLHPTDATKMLDRLNDALLKIRVIADRTIDPLVLGTQAAHYINHARHLYQLGGQEYQLSLLQKKINREGNSSSCPNGINKDSRENVLPWDIFSGDFEKDLNDKDEALEDCDFVSKECPKCHQKDVKTLVRQGKYYGECGCVG